MQTDIQYDNTPLTPTKKSVSKTPKKTPGKVESRGDCINLNLGRQIHSYKKRNGYGNQPLQLDEGKHQS